MFWTLPLQKLSDLPHVLHPKQRRCPFEFNSWTQISKQLLDVYVQMRNNQPPLAAKKGVNTRDSTAISLIKTFREGPEVSFKGSPTVSPITAALCESEPFGPNDFACSDRPACNTKHKKHQKIRPPNRPAKKKTSKTENPITSMYFFALSQAPPVFDAEMAIWNKQHSHVRS